MGLTLKLFWLRSRDEALYEPSCDHWHKVIQITKKKTKSKCNKNYIGVKEGDTGDFIFRNALRMEPLLMSSDD